MVKTALWQQYRRAALDGKTSDCILALKEISKISGLDETTINHTVAPRRLKDVSDEELEAEFFVHSSENEEDTGI